ncbi:hypothetical protein WOLCODRAFT_138233 [Wolfiporia cocos MD-104 SS10]|uniref:C2H2-type domain-containing protein n=1 Tax=Wolfiporia cocos (strain MD-104) TaxID=742152 RepID=A0A2H3JWB4_WOLCO|nr:hypothetical protein WOLCODRAFT_138233 [Wolfiporia cocos MD-104 SS10]
MCGGGYWFDATRSSKGPQPRLRNAQMNSAPSLSMQGTVLSGARQTSVAQSMPSAIATDTDIGGQCLTSATQSVFRSNADIDNAAESRFLRLCEGQILYEKHWSLGDLISSPPSASARVQRDFWSPSNSSAKDRRADKTSCNRGDECNGLISERLTVPDEESTYPCGWNTCTSRVGNATLHLHLKKRHGLALTRSSHDPAKMRCEWTGCARLVRPENLEKHIKSIHLRSTKVRCDRCGALISRGDMMARHQRGGCTEKQTRRRKKRE